MVGSRVWSPASAERLPGTACVAGGYTELRDVMDAVSELSLFGGGLRVIVVEDADDFVKQYREQLEDYVARPRESAVLVLEVTTWPSNKSSTAAANIATQER